MSIREVLLNNNVARLNPKFTIFNKVIKNEKDFELKKIGIELFINTIKSHDNNESE